MPLARAVREPGPPRASFAQAASAVPLTTLVYRSWAAQPFSGSELLGLTTAQIRNRSESVASLMLDDGAGFCLWVEVLTAACRGSCIPSATMPATAMSRC